MNIDYKDVLRSRAMNHLDKRIVEILKAMNAANPGTMINDQTWQQAAEKLNREGCIGARLWNADLLKSYCREMVRRLREIPSSPPSLIDHEQDTRNALRNGLTVINGGVEKKNLRKPNAVVNHQTTVLSHEEILKEARIILEKIQTREKEYTGGCHRKMSTVKTKIVGGRLPVDLNNELNRLKGSKTYHLERALRFYLKLLEAR